VARLGVTTVVAGALVVVPVAAPVSSAVSTPLSATWTGALASALGTYNKIYKLEDNGLYGGAAIALTFAGPILTTIFGSSGPTLQDVLDELNGIQDTLKQMQQQLADVSAQISESQAVEEADNCAELAAQVTDDVTTVQTAASAFDDYLDDLPQIRTSIDVAQAQNGQNTFVDDVIGSTASEVENTPLATAIDDIHNALVGGATDGIIAACGQAFFTAWQNDNLTAPAAGDDDPALWVDDRQYYQRITDLVQHYQVVESNAMFLLEQAVLIKVAQGWAPSSPTLTKDNADQICRLVSAETDPAGAVWCATLSDYGTTFYDQIVAEWEQAGVPYSDDKVMMSLGSDLTGVGRGTPSALWARDPTAAGGIPWATQKQAWSTRQTAATLDGVPGFMPALQADWDGLRIGYFLMHETVIPAMSPALQPFVNPDDTFRQSGTWPYQPFDMLATMQSVTATDGNPAFNSTAAGITQVWMPGQTGTADMSYISEFGNGVPLNAAKMLQFAGQSWIDPDVTDDLPASSMNPQPFYGDVGLSTRCMVLSPDGELCDSRDIGSWWTARMSAHYTVPTDGSGQGAYTASATYTVQPLNTGAGTFTANGTNSQCGDVPCPVHVQAATLPGWMADFTNTAGTVFTAPDVAAQVWPVAPLPSSTTDPSCTNSWGMPSRCGAAMAVWLAANIPNPAAQTPQSPIPTITPGTGGTVNCSAPAWTPATDTANAALVPGSQVTWTATVPGSTTVYTLQNAVTAGGGTVSPASVVTSSGDAAPTQLTLSCSYSAAYGDSLGTVGQAASRPTRMSLVNGNWVVDKASLKVAVTESGPDPTDGSLTSSVVVTNTGNVPVSAVTVTHVASGAAPLSVTWPHGTPTLAPGEKAVGTAKIDVRAAAVAVPSAVSITAPSAVPSTVSSRIASSVSSSSPGSTPASGTSSPVGPSGTRPSASSAAPSQPVASAGSMTTSGSSARLPLTSSTEQAVSSVGAGPEVRVLAVSVQATGRTPNEEAVAAAAAASASLPTPVPAAPELAATGAPLVAVLAAALLLATLGVGGMVAGRRRRSA
jgi:hypothetical protein